MPDLEIVLEAERRGILPPDKSVILDEARKRGLVPPLADQELSAAQMATMQDAPPSVHPDMSGALLTDFQNQFDAAGQSTTPIMSAQEPNLVSDEVFEDELGNMNYRDPETGAVVPTDQGKHIALRDPRDQKIKIFMRTPETTENMASSTGRILTTGVLGIPGGVAAKAAGRVAPAITAAKPVDAVTAAAQRIAPSMPRASVGGPIGQSVAAKLADTPVVGRPLEKAGQTAVDEMGRAASFAAEGYGSANVSKAGAAARKGVEGYITTLSKQSVERLYNRVDDLVDPLETARLPATENAAAKINMERMAARLPESKAVSIAQDALASPEGLTYEGIKTLRTHIGTMLDSGLLPADIAGGDLKRIYKALTIDLRNAAKAAGGEKAVAAWDKANRTAKLVAERRENLMRVVGSKNDEGIIASVQKYASTSSRADLKLLRQARKAAGPDAWDEISSAIIERLGVGKDGQFSPLTFATAWNKRLTLEGKRVLFRSTGKPQLASILDDLATLSTAAQQAQRYVNTSKTGAYVAVGGFTAALMTEPLLALSTALTGNVLARFLARPVAAKAILDWSKVYNKRVRLSRYGGGQSLHDMYLQSSKVLSEALAAEAGVPELAPKIFKELEGIGGGLTEEQLKREQERDDEKRRLGEAAPEIIFGAGSDPVEHKPAL